MLEDLDPQARGADWFSAQTEAARLRLVQVVAKNPFFSHAFDPNSERDYSKLSVDEDQEYKDFVLGVCRRLTASTFESGDLVCHRGEQGDGMYLIFEGSIGVFIENKTDEIEKQSKKLDFLNEVLEQHSATPVSEATVLKDLDFAKKAKIVENIKKHFLSEERFLHRFLTHFDKVDCWSKEQLHLLASDKPQQYMRNCCFLYWMVTKKRPGDIIGEQALLSRDPRNASLLALTKATLLMLSKADFDKYMGAVAEKQEERVRFFSACFPTISKRILGNFHCMFTRGLFSRGELITSKGSPADCLYLVEEGEVVLVNPDKLSGMRYVVPSKLEPFLKVGKMGVIGDELLNGLESYLFSSVALQQPTVVYWCEKAKIEQSWNIIGKEVIAELRQLAAQRQQVREEMELQNKLVKERSKQRRQEQPSEPVFAFVKNKESKLAASLAQKSSFDYPPLNSQSLGQFLKKMNVQKRYTHINPKFKIASTASLPYQPALSIQLDTFNFRFDKAKPSVADGVKVSQSKSRLYRSIDLDRDLLSPSHKPLEAIRICNIPTRELLLEQGSTGGDKSRVEFGRGFEKNSRSRIRLDGMNQTEGSINPSLLLSPTNKNFVSLITALEKRPEPAERSEKLFSKANPGLFIKSVSKIPAFARSETSLVRHHSLKHIKRHKHYPSRDAVSPKKPELSRDAMGWHLSAGKQTGSGYFKS